MSLLRFWPYAVSGLAVLGISLLFFAWQNAEASLEASQVETRTLQAELAATARRTAALEKAATERAVDTRERTNETDKVSDALDRIEQKVKTNAPVPIDAAARAVSCSRLRRQGSTDSALYRARCG